MENSPIDIFKQVTYFLVPLMGIVWLVNFCLMSFYRYQEEKLHTEKNIKINDIRGQVVPTSSIEGSIKIIEEQYRKEFESLERKKQFLRDIIPFLKK